MRKEIEAKISERADIALRDPTLFNSREKNERRKIKSFLAEKINSMIISAGRSVG